MRRGVAVFLCVLCLLAATPGHAALETDVPISLNCPSALLMEPLSGQVIFEKNADERRAVASVTKIMAILLTIESIDQGRCTLEDIVNISANAAGMGGSQVLLDVGEQQPVEALLKSMIVASANDATVAIGEFLYGSEQAFVKRMNERARELNMNDTVFVNATGLPAQGQYTTARDVAEMSRVLIAKPLYFHYSTIWMDNLNHGDGRVTDLTNTNRLTRLYDGCDGIKTGSTNEAGYCISASAARGGMRLIAIVLGAKTSKDRFDTASAMMDYGFANYRVLTVAERGAKVRGQLPVTGGSLDRIEVMLGEDLTLLLSKGGDQDIELKPSLPESIAAPVEAGARVGTVDVLLSGRVVGRVPVVACEAVASRGYFDGWRILFGSWFYTNQSP